MKDAHGHGSNPRGAQNAGIEAALTPAEMRPLSSMRPFYDASLTDKDKAIIENMRQTLRNGGTLPPMTVLPDGRLDDGNHRWHAYKAEGVEEAPVYARPRTWAEIKEDDRQKTAFYGRTK
jgi:ParB-like chromosome segregation protein Spo0J